MDITARPCIGIFDSGLGGLSVLREIHHQLPDLPLFYFADQAHVPYGKKKLAEIREYALGITSFLLNVGAQLIVVACNTASAAALNALRQKFPNVPFVGMEPAIKPATLRTKSGTVGVLATPATFQGEMFTSLLERFGSNIKILTNTAPGLVEAIEEGELDSAGTRKIIEKGVKPMIAQGADTIVLGCTHFPFVLPLIQEIVGPNVAIIDPAPAIAKRTAFLIQQKNIQFPHSIYPSIKLSTSGDAWRFRIMAKKFIGTHADTLQIHWRGQELMLGREG